MPAEFRSAGGPFLSSDPSCPQWTELLFPAPRSVLHPGQSLGLTAAAGPDHSELTARQWFLIRVNPQTESVREEAATARRRPQWVTLAWRVLPTPAATPFTFCYLVVLLVTANIQHLAGTRIAARLLAASSTDADNLVHHPVSSIISSALWFGGKEWPAYAVIFAVAVAPLERRIGSGRTFAVFASGHVLATLATEVPMIIALRAGIVPREAGRWIDVGVSYGFFATAGAMAILLVPKQRRWAVAGIELFIAVICVTDAPGTLPTDLTFAGHLIAAHIGMFGWLGWLRRRGYVGSVRIGGVRGASGEIRSAVLAVPPAA